MTPPRVAAVLAEGSPAVTGRQTEPVQDVFAGPGALARARASDAQWLWFLAAGARAREDALQRLLLAAEPADEPRASLVAGMVLDEHDRRPVEDELPAPDRADIGAVIHLVALHLCPIRHATLANCLVARAAFERHGCPDVRAFGRHAAVEWTARVLRMEAGRFCADSVVVLSPAEPRRGPRSALAHAPATLRMARSGAWTRGESLEAFARLVAEARIRRGRRAPDPG
jgi:hypothetical protein